MRPEFRHCLPPVWRCDNTWFCVTDEADSPWQKPLFSWSDSLSSPCWSPSPAGSPSGKQHVEHWGWAAREYHTQMQHTDVCLHEWAAPALAPGYRRWLWPPHRNSTAARSHDQKTPKLKQTEYMSGRRDSGISLHLPWWHCSVIDWLLVVSFSFCLLKGVK